MSLSPSLYITAIFNLEIEEDLGEGLEIRNGIKLTNNLTFIRSLLTSDLMQALGGLEFTALYKAKAIFYKISDELINHSNDDDLVCNFLAECKLFVSELWMIKDHSIDIMLGFAEYPYYNSKKIELPFHSPIVHSNWVTGGSFTAKGASSYTKFRKKEIHQIIEWGADTVIIPFTENEKKKTNIRPGSQRLTRSTIFLQTARQCPDLGIKITHYCSALECLFSTDPKELTHKLAERISYFLEKSPQKRVLMYNQIKTIYTIRSQVTHGAHISAKHYKEIEEYSSQADALLRRVLVKLQDDRTFDRYYRMDNTQELEKYLTELTLGLDQFDQQAKHEDH